MTDPPNLIGAAEACRRLGIDRSTLTRWTQLGKIAVALRLPGPRGVMLFDPDVVEARRTEYAESSK